MTTDHKAKVRCSVCGAESEFTVITSTNTHGAPDLDARPPEMARSTMFTWVQRCPDCGYCASEVSAVHSGAQEVVNSKEYRDQLNDPAYPELANSFLCMAIVDCESGDFPTAAWALIHAAWACDDSDSPDQAMACRRKAADTLRIAEDHGLRVAGREGDSAAILVDLLRRSGQMEEARKVIAAQRGRGAEDIIARVLNFQSSLFDKNDLCGHTLAEIPGEEE